MTLILSTNAFATMPLAIPPYVIFENLVNTQKQAHSRCLDKANHEKEMKDCYIMLEGIKAMEKKSQPQRKSQKYAKESAITNHSR